ncbi:MAG: oligosaccharide flippase family protein [Bacteroidales bacterium]|nr:oligosaccharide flippase family protein [Bacteroidales bacterium]
MSLKKTILKNVVSEWISKIIIIASALIITPVLLSYFGKYQYGLWEAIGQGAAFLMLFDFGIANSIARFIAKNSVTDDFEENKRVYSTSLAVFFFAAVLTLFISLIVLPYIPEIFNTTENYQQISQVLFGILSLNIIVAFPLRVGRGLLQAKDRYDLISLIQLFFNVIYLILVLLFFYRGIGDLILLAEITLSVNLLSEIVLFLIALKYHKYLKFKFRYITKKNFKELFSLGASSLVQSISAMLYTKGIILSVSIMIGLAATPLFSIPNSIINKIGPFVNRLGSTFVPIASRMNAKNDIAKLRELNIHGVRYGLAISIPISVFLFFYGKQLLELWLGNTGLNNLDLQNMAYAVAVMIVPFGLGAPQTASRAIFRATNKHWFVANLMLISVSAGLITTIILIKYTDLGILGAAIGWSFRYLIVDILVMPFAVCRNLQINIKHYFSKVYLPPLFSALVLIVFSLVYNRFIDFENIYNFIILITVFGILSFLLILFIILNAEHRKFLIKKIRFNRK